MAVDRVDCRGARLPGARSAGCRRRRSSSAIPASSSSPRASALSGSPPRDSAADDRRGARALRRAVLRRPWRPLARGHLGGVSSSERAVHRAPRASGGRTCSRRSGSFSTSPPARSWRRHLARGTASVAVVLTAALATPLLFYGLEFWEHAPAVGRRHARHRLASRACERQNRTKALIAGLLYGLAILLRPEAICFVVAVVAASRAAAGAAEGARAHRWRSWACCCRFCRSRSIR